MKRVEIKKGRVIETPWLRIDEAAAYCGVARSTFVKQAKHLPFSGSEEIRLYHCNILDRFINGDIVDAPFTEPELSVKKRSPHRQCDDGNNYLIDPVNGKVYAARMPRET